MSKGLFADAKATAWFAAAIALAAVVVSLVAQSFVPDQDPVDARAVERGGTLADENSSEPYPPSAVEWTSDGGTASLDDDVDSGGWGDAPAFDGLDSVVDENDVNGGLGDDIYDDPAFHAGPTQYEVD